MAGSFRPSRYVDEGSTSRRMTPAQAVRVFPVMVFAATSCQPSGPRHDAPHTILPRASNQSQALMGHLLHCCSAGENCDAPAPSSRGSPRSLALSRIGTRCQNPVPEYTRPRLRTQYSSTHRFGVHSPFANAEHRNGATAPTPQPRFRAFLPGEPTGPSCHGQLTGWPPGTPTTLIPTLPFRKPAPAREHKIRGYGNCMGTTQEPDRWRAGDGSGPYAREENCVRGAYVPASAPIVPSAARRRAPGHCHVGSAVLAVPHR